MAKKLLGVLTALALLGGVLSAATASAQEAPATAIPEVANIEDVAEDANGLNDQGAGLGFGDTPGGAYVGAADILKVWFTNDATKINAHILTSSAPPNSTFGLLYRIYFTEVEGCGLIEGFVPSVTWSGEASATLVCAEDIAGEIKIETATDELGLTTLSFDRAVAPVFAAGSSLAAPQAYARGAEGTPETGGVVVPVFDSTAEGTDYTITDGPVVDPGDPPKVDPPVKKGCKKGKGKKKGCKKPKCPTFTPAASGAEAPITVVTDAATEEAPIEIPIAAGAGIPEADVTHVFHNLQVDSKNKDAGLYARLEFPAHEDLDLYLRNQDESVAAQAAGFNPFPFIPHNEVFWTDGTGAGGHSEQGAEQVDGSLTPDCGGYTADVGSYASEGGDMVLKVWLGPATWDPVAQAPIENEG